MKEAHLYEKSKNNVVRCKNCSHYCLIAPGKRGLCGARENTKGKLCVLNYGKVTAFNVDPIEKKPFFHFLPGTHSLSIAAAGCNFSCFNCQNYDISQGYKKKEIPGEFLAPETIISIALKSNIPSISYTYTEPTIFLEYALDIMKLARKKKLKNAFVSNGFMSRESAEIILPHLDAINIDIKGFSEEFYKKNCGARLQPVLDNAKLIKKSGIWTEITTLIIPTLSDSEKSLKKTAEFIRQELGEETPWHISQFSGDISWKLQQLPDTRFETLENAYKIGKAAGLSYVYTGNVPGSPAEKTFCPGCKALCIDRTGYLVNRLDNNGKCRECGQNLHLVLN